MGKKRRYRWTDNEITKLIDWGLLQFLPHDYLPVPKLAPAARDRQLDSLREAFTPRELADLETEVKQLGRLALGWEQLDFQVYTAAAKVIPYEESGAKLDQARRYLRSLIGLRPTLREDKNELVRVEGAHGRRCLSLVAKDQLSCLLRWTGLRGILWICFPWIECMKLRYGSDTGSPMALLKRSDRRRLDAAVLRLTEEDKERLQSEKQLDGIPSLIGFDRGRSGVVQVVCEEYLRAKLADQLDRQHVLYRSFREAGVFQRAARRVVVPMGLNERDRASFQRQFLRYLHISDNHPDAVVGRVLYELLMIVYPTGSRSQTSEFASAWWQQVPPGHPFAPVPDEVRWVGDLIMDALGANRRLTELIWLAHLHWRMGRMWQKLTGRFLPVFRAAKFLKDREGWIYRRYRDQVDYFHARTVKLLLKLERRGLLRIRERECALRSFRHSLRKEPLLNCVFHADVLQGKRLVMPPQGRADNLVYPRLMALVVHVLRKAHPRTPAVTVQDVFRNEKGLPENALRAITPSARDKDQRVGGYSHFAYAAPLVATILGVSLINADTVKDNFKRYRDDCEVRRQRELLGL